MEEYKYYILRHAEREELKSNVAKAILTEKGKRDAYELGIKMSKLNNIVILSSCFRRSYQTAAYFQQGLGKGKLIVKERITDQVMEVKEGYFARWWREPKKEFFEYISSKPIAEIQEEWFSGKMENTLTPKECVERDLKIIREIEEKEKPKHIFIFSHDSTVSYYYYNSYKKNLGSVKLLGGIKSNDLIDWELV